MGPAIRGLDRGENFPGEAGAAANVEDQGWGGETEQLEGAVGHFGLNVLDPRRGGIFSRFGVIVEEVGRAVASCQLNS